MERPTESTADLLAVRCEEVQNAIAALYDATAQVELRLDSLVNRCEALRTEVAEERRALAESKQCPVRGEDGTSRCDQVDASVERLVEERARLSDLVAARDRENADLRAQNAELVARIAGRPSAQVGHDGECAVCGQKTRLPIGSDKCARCL